MQVYVIERPDGHVKIGRAKNPTLRIKGLETQGGFISQRAWMSLPGAFSANSEIRAHHALDSQRTVGEWFTASFEEAVAAVIEHGQPPRASVSGPMDSRQARADNLGLLLQRYGQNKTFAAATGLVPAHVSQLKNGVRAMGDEIARRIESRLSLPHGWMDRAHGDQVQTADTQQAMDDGEAKAILAILTPLSTDQRQQALKMLAAFVKSCQ